MTDESPYGRWTLVHPTARKDAHRNRIWLCRCSCGTEVERPIKDIQNGSSKSCGCLRAEQLAERNRASAGQSRKYDARHPKAKPPKPCDGCGTPFVPFRDSARWCSGECKARTKWRNMNAEERAAHNARVCAASRKKHAVPHTACESCGQPFTAPPSRKFCSRECLEEKIRSGVYRNAFHQRRVAAELAAVAAELESRFRETENRSGRPGR